jgi:hypothetical protein
MAGMTTEAYAPLLAELVQVQPRRILERKGVVDVNNATAANASSSAAAAADEHSRPNEDVDSLVCLFHTTRKLLSDEKTKVHARIVVIGASTTGLAFIHALLSVPYLSFTNILLVSNDGLPLHPNQQEMMWRADTMDFLEREYIALSIGRRIRVLEGTMIDFDKFDKYICTDGSICEPYDHLLITAGRQYAIPKELLSQHGGAKNGVFPLSNAHNIAKIKQHIHEREIYEDDLSNAVIYGSNLDVYAVATCVIQQGLAPQRVVIVSPDGGQVNPFTDPLVELKVEKLLASVGTKVVKGHVLERLEYDEDNDLSGVVVAPVDGTKGKSMELNATMFIYCHEKDIDMQVLSALNKRSIVFDGRVIIENNYRTTDHNIYAAGPVAMFSRRFGPSEDFDMYSARNVGRHVAEALLGFIGIDEFYDPVLHKEDDVGDLGPKDDPLAAELGSAKRGGEDTRRRPKALPRYEENVCRRVVLPSAHIFFTCSSVAFSSIADSCTFLTSSSESGGEYVRVAVGPNKYIESVCYFGAEEVEMHNLASLVGMPESTLNLMYRYSEVNKYSSPQGSNAGYGAFQILDYLRSPWATAIFYDRFPGLFAKVKAALKEHPDAIRVKQDLLQHATEQKTDTITEEERDKYHRRLSREHSSARHTIELELIKYLHEAKAFLPQLYYLPDIHAHVPRQI